jgi:hypothetical protein
VCMNMEPEQAAHTSTLHQSGAREEGGLHSVHPNTKPNQCHVHHHTPLLPAVRETPSQVLSRSRHTVVTPAGHQSQSQGLLRPATCCVSRQKHPSPVPPLLMNPLHVDTSCGLGGSCACRGSAALSQGMLHTQLAHHKMKQLHTHSTTTQAQTSISGIKQKHGGHMSAG